MAITQGKLATVTATLKVGGVVVNIPLSATVTAQLFADNNATPLGMPAALAAYGTALHQHGRVLKVQIEQAEDFAALASIKIWEGWPT